MGIDEILGDIAGFDGVACAFVCDPEGKVLAGRATMQAFLCLSTLGESADELDLSFEKGRVVVRSAGPLASLTVVCQPSINALMLRLRTAMAVTAIAAEMEAARREQSSPHLNMRVRDTLKAALGEKAGKFLALVSAAGESPEKLAAAGSEAVRFAKLFFGKEKAEALQSQLRSVLGEKI